MKIMALMAESMVCGYPVATKYLGKQQISSGSFLEKLKKSRQVTLVLLSLCRLAKAQMFINRLVVTLYQQPIFYLDLNLRLQLLYLVSEAS